MSLRVVPTDDPLSLALAPPIDETEEERRVREEAEAEAKRVSDEIDRQIAREREEEGRRKRPVKLIVVGQSGSGKTTMIRNFHRTYAKEEWNKERASWRAVIYLNLIQGINNILEHLVAEMAESQGERGPQTQNDKGCPKLEFADEHWRLWERLAPLKRAEMELEKILGVVDGERLIPNSTGHCAASDTESLGSMIGSSDTRKSILSRASETVEGEITERMIDCCADIRSLWDNSEIKGVLSRRKARALEAHVRFFLDNVERIAAKGYIPTDDDIIHARLKTSGIQEYKITPHHGQEYQFYDVGGTRNNRAAWHPYLDDDAIIFLAPLSTFDEKMPEDERVNRLEDSYLLWKSICSSRLLARAQIILLLNKCDILQAKLQRGIQIRDSIPSYGDRKNDLQTSTQYFQQHFKEIARQYSPVNRPFYVHLTSTAVDEKSMACALGALNNLVPEAATGH